MIAFPAGTRVWIAGGVTDMRCGMNSLALKIRAKVSAATRTVARSSAFAGARPTW